MSWRNDRRGYRRQGAWCSAGLARAAEEGFGVETLEPRTLLFAWSAEEVYLSELVNRARANPAAEAQRLGLDLTSGLTSAELARLVAQEPLALNEALTRAARDHSLDMAVRNYFSHTSPAPEYSTPTSRAQSYGYPGTAGENIAAGYTTIDAVHRAWLQSVGHRKNVLSLHAGFDQDFHYDELGVGLAFDAGGNYDHYFTQSFGYQGASPVRYILGVVFDDLNGNGFYGIGEGAANVRIDVRSGETVVGTYTTDAAGNYQIVAAAGAYTVRFTDLGTGRTFDRQVTVTDQNVKADATIDEINPPPPGDDHADAAQWADATVIPIDPATGNGTYAGRFEAVDDTDLFRFTASVAGVYQISVNAISANQHVMAVYSGSQQLIVTTPGGQSHASYDLTAAAGQTFYLLVSGNVVQVNGNYVVLVEGPGSGGEPQEDDHADSSEWTLATVIAIDPTTGDGTDLGAFESADDTDLFRITTSVAGVYRISVNGLSANTHVLTVFNGEQQLVATTAGGQQNAVYELDAAAGATFYLRVSGAISQLNGSYAVLIEGPGGGPDPDPDQGHLAEASLPLGGGMMIDGRYGMSYLSAELRPMFAIRNGDGSWTRIDLLNEAGGPGVQGRLVTWSDARDGSTYVAARSDAGVIVYERKSDGTWSVRNLSQQLNRPKIDGELTVFIENNGRAHISGLTAAGKLLDYKMMGVRNAQGAWRWSFLNVSNTHLAFRGRAMPAMAGEFESFVTPRGSWNVVGLDTQGNIQLFFKEKGLRWDVVNLSEFAGTPILSGGLTVYQGADRSIGIVGTAANGNTWITGFIEGQGWRVTNASLGKTVAKKMRGGGLAAYVNEDGVRHIVGLNAAGRIVMYKYNAATDRWAASVPTNLVGGGGELLTGDLTATVGTDGVSVNIVGQTSEGRIIRYSWRPGEGWRDEDVSALLAA